MKSISTFFTALLLAPLAAPLAAQLPHDAKAWLDFNEAATVEAVGAVKAGSVLAGAERTLSLRAGGDGKVAVFEGGHFKLPAEVWSQWNAAGDAATIYVRIKPAGGKLMPCGLFSTRRNDQSGINLSVLSLNRVDTFLNLVTAFPRGAKEATPLDGADAANRKGTFINAPIEKLPAAEWYDIVLTRDGLKSQLFVNGSLVAFRSMGGSYALAAHWFPLPATSSPHAFSPTTPRR